MNKIYSTDRPVSNEQDDKFQRYDFSKRIANTIVERDSNDCIVIGIYGAWGEGKTSVISFIETELNEKKDVITIQFNPWRYSDESTLILSFFNKIAKALNVPLFKQHERIGRWFRKNSEIINYDVPKIGDISKVVGTIGSWLGTVDLEKLKDRLDETIIKSKKKLVIFIDDIDRLDKTELHSIFRLVKLTADFPNTTYILSFDEEMVSSAIGERFGAGNQVSGQNFLEKIIQVPLKIPIAQPDALRNFCFQLVEKALNFNNIEMSEQDIRRFTSEFSENILPKLDTPRLAVRYGNSLSFSLPLLVGEVDIVDVMLMEAIKVFYPNHYELIKSNPEYFIDSYYNGFNYNAKKNEEKINTLKERLEKLGENLTRKQKNCIQNLLKELFPRLEEVFHNYSNHRGWITNKWFKDKRITSPKYFNKYFSYTVIKGELSDIAFESFLSAIPSMEVNNITDNIKTLVEQSSPDNFLRKIRSIEEDLGWETSVKVAKAIAVGSEIFPENKGGTFLYTFQSADEQVAIFIYQLIKKHEDKEEQFALAKELMNDSQPFDFAYSLIRWLKTGKEEGKLFTNEQYIELTTTLLNRALKEAGEIPIFEKFPDSLYSVWEAWAKTNKKGLDKYIESILDKTPSKVVDFLRSLTPTIYSSSVIGPYKVDFDKKRYQYFISLFDKDYINKIINIVFSEKELNAEDIKWVDMKENAQTDINIVRQFRYWLQEETSIKVSDNI